MIGFVADNDKGLLDEKDDEKDEVDDGNKHQSARLLKLNLGVLVVRKRS